MKIDLIALLKKGYRRLWFLDQRLSFCGKLLRGALVLDIGSGAGAVLESFLELREDLKASAVDKVDFSNCLPDRIDFVTCDIELQRLPWTDETFDAVIVTHVLEHLRDPYVAICEAFRVLKVGGSIYVESPSIRSLFLPSCHIGIEQGGPLNFYDNPSHLRPFSRAGLLWLLRHCGFDEIRVG